ncbi:hypothetical protein DNU06_10965 [Putridiphycobacter roseus]|uniref:DUF6985 domain-containing protein n=1 Tax=Putridiphycobacter roseus TaxID=2219161 RepID=A0A2W1NCG8_9FLAO|nr:hypothetical protein [Putridiphycobacter roseus]PZE16773.1 hypothetical protein DNU06_10965 [Putridiphycobacter roseus]
MQQINTPTIGTLTQNEKFQEWWRSAAINIPFVGMDLPVTFMDFIPENDALFLKEAEEAIQSFMNLESTYKFQIAEHVMANFKEVASYLGEEGIPKEMKNVNLLSIWNFVYPTEIFMSRRHKADKDVYLILACECEWEKEHGLQFVFRQGRKLTRVSDQDGHLTNADAFDIPDSEDKLLRDF